MTAVVFALCLVVGIGILCSNLYAACHCYGACQYCDWETEECTVYDEAGACFCTDRGGDCSLGRLLCCQAH